jgi:23S rRNA-/tRNA-specific pseudouridylate synthase
VCKIYFAVVEGNVREPGVVAAAIAHHPKSERRMIVAREAASGALPARTEYEPLRAAGGRTLLRVTIHEGRRHQIRVHLASAGLPIVGDDVYGSRASGTSGGASAAGKPGAESGAARDAPRGPRLGLHAHRVLLPHPTTGRDLSIASALPRDLEEMLGD